MNHSLVSGVAVEREWQKIHKTSGVSMPVVFTGGFGVNSNQNQADEAFGNIVYGESQTPQVWIDHQASEQNGRLYLSWDAVCGLFPENFIENMFESYKEVVYSLLDRKNWENNKIHISLHEIDRIHAQTWETAPVSGETLITLFEKAASAYADRCAVESLSEQVTYEQCARKAGNMAANLMKAGVCKGDVVAVMMDKSALQIYSVLAILKAGAVYLPVDPHNPLQRIQSILETAQAVKVLTEERYIRKYAAELAKWELEDAGELLCRDGSGNVVYPEVKDEDTAYIIFTSGSTGLPKGVVISHRGAVNTILDVNKRFGVTERDGTIFVSNLNFDLSVYDIFGMLSAGGAVVVPDADSVKDPSHWLELLLHHNVTIWNSVPAFLQMLADYKDERKDRLRDTLRLIMMSGDWIPIALPDRLRKVFSKARIISLGGATEASIWSNYFVIPDGIPENWKSIPYGKPLTNQKFYILNEHMQNCPVWVTGELYIGGTGVAKGYYNDPVRTEDAFIRYGNEIVYRTGDLGRYMADGNIEFLGREDNQIKKNGHRIECGEIEAQIRRIDGIRDAVVTADKNSHMMLTAHLSLKDGGSLCQKAENLFPDDGASYKDELLQAFGNHKMDDAILRFQSAVSLLSMEMICRDLSAIGIENTDEVMADTLKGRMLSENGEAILNLYIRQLEESSNYEQNMPVSQMADIYHEQWNAAISEESQRSLILSLQNRLEQSQKTRLDVLTGKLESHELLIDENRDFLLPMEMRNYDLGGPVFKNWLTEALTILNENVTDAAILEIGSRAADNTNLLLDVFGDEGSVTYGDESDYYIDLKKNSFSSKIEYLKLDLQEKCVVRPNTQYELIVADNTLHRMKNVDIALENLKEYLKPGGVLLLCENTRNAPLMLLTTAYLEDGYRDIEDQRKINCLPMLTKEEWVQKLLENGISLLIAGSGEGRGADAGKWLMIFRRKNTDAAPAYESIRKEITEVLPEYMVPENIIIYRDLPLSENGKTDRRLLADLAGKFSFSAKKEVKRPVTELQNKILSVWLKVMQCEDASIDENFFTSGGDSLKAIIFINALKEQENYEISLQELFENPSVEQLADFLETRNDSNKVIEMVEGEL